MLCDPAIVNICPYDYKVSSLPAEVVQPQRSFEVECSPSLTSILLFSASKLSTAIFYHQTVDLSVARRQPSTPLRPSSKKPKSLLESCRILLCRLLNTWALITEFHYSNFSSSGNAERAYIGYDACSWDPNWGSLRADALSTSWASISQGCQAIFWTSPRKLSSYPHVR